MRYSRRLTVRLLEPRPGTGTAELLGLAPAVVGDEEGAVELDEGLLEEVLGVLVDVLLVVGDQGLGDGLADGVDLRGVTTAGDADADVNCVNVSRKVRRGPCRVESLPPKRGDPIFEVGWISNSRWGYVPCENLSRPRTRRGS